jgi:uncharacterized repeat protein (TIGR02543 family)
MKKRHLLFCLLFLVALLGFILRSPPAGSGFIADAPPPDEHAAVFPEPSELVEVPVEDSLRNAASGEAGGRAAFTVESEVPHHRFPGREALRAGDETISERWLDEEVRSALEAEGEARLGRRERIVLRESFKHPLLRRVEEVYPGPDGARRVRVLRETVADHVVVRLRPQADIEAVVAALADEGVLLRHSARAGNIHTLAFAIDDAERHVRLLSRLKHDPRVAVADEDDLYYALDEPEPPNDPDFPVLWGLHNTGQDSYAEGRPPGTPGADIDALRAWQRTTGSSDVIIAVIDGGIDYTHEDLAANMWVNPDPDAPDRHGYDFFDDDPDPMPTNNNDGHGTHVAGTIGAVGNNSIGVTGVNWQTRIMALRFLGPGGGTSADGAAAMHYAIDNGAHIVNNSWGGTQSNTVLEDAIRRANDEEVLMVMAAGNDGSNNDLSPRYPANYDFPNVITVAASDRNDRRAGFSNYGIGSVHLAAPGVEIASTFPNNAYRRTDGTSMAAPHVAGVAGLIASYLGTDTPATRLRQIILDNVDPIDSLRPLVSTGGRLNAHESLAGIVTAPFSGHARLSFDDSQHGGNNDGYLNPGERILSTLHVIHYGETAVSGLTASLSVVSGGEVITLNDGSHTISELSPGGSYVFADAFDFTIAETVPETPHTVTFSLSITDGSETWSRQVSAVIRDVFTLEGTVLLDDSPFPTTDEVRIEYRGPVEGFLTPEADGSYSLNLPQGAYEVRAVLRDSFHYEEYLGDWVYGSAWTLVDGFVEGSVVHDVRFRTGYLRGRVSSFPGVGIAHASVKTEWAFPWNEDYYTARPGDFLYRTPYRYQFTRTDEHGDYEIEVIVPEGETAEMRKAIFSHRAYGATETGESLSFVLPETELNATLYAGSINMERPDITLIVPPDSVSSHSLRLYNTGTRAETVFITDTMPYYSWETMSYTWLELNQGTGTRVEAWDYDESIRNSEDMVTSERKQHRISLGFDMPYYQGTARTVYVHADGWLSLRGPDPSLKLGVHLGNGVPYTSGDRERPDVIAPLWMDWTVNDGRFLENLYYHQPDSDTLILQWDRRIGGTVYSYQAWLHRDGRIHFVYKNLPVKSITNGFLGYAGISDRWCVRGITLERSNSTVHPWSVLGNNTRIGFTPQPAWLNTHSARTQIQADDWHEIQFSVDSTGKAIGDYEASIYAMFADNRAIQRAAGSEWQADASLRIRLKVREGDELIADAGPDRRLRLGTAITLDGRASIGPQPLTYTWAQIDGPGPTLPLTHSDQAQAFIALGPDGMENPAVFGSYTFELTVNDGESSASDTVTVEVLPRNVALNKPVVATSGTVFTYRPGNRDHEDFWQALPRVEAITDGYFEREGWINFWAGKAEAGDGGSKPRIWFEIDLEGTYQLHEAAIYYEMDSVMASFDDCWIEYKGTDGVWRLLTPKWRRGGWPRPEWVDTFADYPPIEGGPVSATAVRMIQEVAAASAVLVIRDFQLYGMRLSEYDTEPNTPPVAQSADYEVDQEASVQIELLASDADDDRLTYSLVSQPGHGSLHGSPPHLLYKPDPGYHGSDAFSFLASDGQALSNIATIRITVHPVAHPPVAVDDRARTIPGEAVAVEVLLNDRSRDNRPLQVLSVGTPGHGSVNLVNGNVHYTPHEDWQGLDSFTYTIADDRDLQSSAEIHIFTGDPLVAHLPLEEDALDITDYEHHGSLDGASIEAGWGLGGGGALRILAEDQALQVAADGALTEDTLHRRSVAWWMNLDQLRVEGREQILYQEGNGSDADAPFLEVAVDSTGRLRARISDPAWPEGQQQPALEYGLVSQSWQHVAVVFDGSDSGAPGSLSLYLDGERIDQVTVGNALAARNGFVHFANDGAREQAALGRFNDLRIYDWALTPPEVAEIASFDPPPGFTLTYEANGGEGAVPAALTAPAGQNLVLPGPGGMSKPGHAFNGWRDVLGAVTYAAGDTLVMPARDFTLAAQWTVLGGAGQYVQPFNNTTNQLVVENAGIGWQRAAHDGNLSADQVGRLSSERGPDGEPGFAYTFRGGNNASLMWYEGLTLSQATLQNFSAYVGHSHGSNIIRFLIRIGENWYASADGGGHAPTVGNAAWFENGAVNYSVTFSPEDTWVQVVGFNGTSSGTFTLLGGGDLTPLAALPSGDITAIGVYLANLGGGSTRFDDFTVTWTGPGDGYTVTYDAGGGSGDAPVDGNQYAAGSPVTVMGQGNLNRDGYTFAGWHDGTTLYQPLDAFAMADVNVTLTAQWESEASDPFDGWWAENSQFFEGLEPDGEVQRRGMLIPIRDIWIAGLDLEGDDLFEISSLDANGLPSFVERDGRQYRIWWTDDLTDPSSWQILKDFTESAPATAPGNGRVFYRLEVRVAE